MSGASRGAILVTGATGMLGSELIEVLRRRGWEDLVGVARRTVRGGDGIVPWTLGEGEPPAQLRREWSVIVNAAADTRWTLSTAEAERANVASVEALRELAGPRTRLIQISTAYAGGLRNDVSSPHLADYRNTYEWSKAAAERLVAEAFTDATIVRPSLIVGRRQDGRVARFTGIFALLRGIVAGTIPAIVTTRSSYLDLVPVDDLAATIADVVADPDRDGELLTVGGGEDAPRVEEAVRAMVEELNRSRAEWGCPPLEVPRAISPQSWDRFFWPFVQRYISLRQRLIIELLRNYEPYLQIEEPLPVTHRVTDVLVPLERSVRYWAEENSSAASRPAHRWRLNPEVAAAAGGGR
jgi:nucleoside-diphosphate-sugar epimerase